jgi:hypothetical protein
LLRSARNDGVGNRKMPLALHQKHIHNKALKKENTMAKQPDFEEMEDFFSENSMEAIAAMSGMVTTQQNIALNLTTLILEHRAKNNLSIDKAKDEVFDLYEEASELVRGQLDI